MFRNPTPRPLIRWTLLLAVPLILAGWVDLAFAKEKSILSPIIHVNKQKGFIVVSTDSGVIGVEVSKEAKRHLGKLPISGMIDLVVADVERVRRARVERRLDKDRPADHTGAFGHVDDGLHRPVDVSRQNHVGGGEHGFGDQDILPTRYFEYVSRHVYQLLSQ